MLLMDLQSVDEREAFANLAYKIARANGSLDYRSFRLLNLYFEELGIISNKPHLQDATEEICKVFTNEHARKVVYLNLLSLTLANECENKKQQNAMKIIQQELAIEGSEARAYEAEIRLLKGLDLPLFSE